MLYSGEPYGRAHADFAAATSLSLNLVVAKHAIKAARNVGAVVMTTLMRDLLIYSITALIGLHPHGGITRGFHF
jgi:hypothetical protein